MDHENLYHHTALQAVPLTRNEVGTVLIRAWLPFVSLFLRVSMHSSTMVHVLLPTLIG